MEYMHFCVHSIMPIQTPQCATVKNQGWLPLSFLLMWLIKCLEPSNGRPGPGKLEAPSNNSLSGIQQHILSGTGVCHGRYGDVYNVLSLVCI